jgi:hypothetical protein
VNELKPLLKSNVERTAIRIWSSHGKLGAGPIRVDTPDEAAQPVCLVFVLRFSNA